MSAAIVALDVVNGALRAKAANPEAEFCGLVVDVGLVRARELLSKLRAVTVS